MMTRFILGLALIVGLVWVQPGEAAVILYTSGHDIDTVAAASGGVTLAGANPTSGFSPTAANLTSALGGGYGAFDALVLGENLGSWDAAAKAVMVAYLTGGGHVVMLGAHGSEAGFLNSTFGYSVTQHIGASSADHASISLVAGTGPATLYALNGSWFLDNAPGTVTYTRDLGGTAAFVDTIGAGTLSWLAWDFCECSEPDNLQADWFSLLGTGAIEDPNVPEPTTLAIWGTLGGLGLIAARRRRKQVA